MTTGGGDAGDPTLPAATGLTSEAAAARLREHGPNELPTARGRGLSSFASDILHEPMFLLLLATAGIYLVLGDPAEATALLGAVLLIVGITIYQQQKTENALRALRDLSSPRALVVRDGATRRIPGREVVPGDLVVLREGDRVPADGVVVAATNLQVDESLLTGESVAVRKRPAGGAAGEAPALRPPGEGPPKGGHHDSRESWRPALAGHAPSAAAAPEGTPGGEDQPLVWSGTWIVRGDGLAAVTATGARTQLGKIGKSLASVDVGRTALQNEVDRLVRVLAVLGLGACVVLGLAYGLARHNWLEGALAGLTLAISMVPEEFAVILTVFLALGAWRIARSRVLTRRLPAIETLGAADVLCVDKTGTLTMNRMSVAAVVTDEAVHSVTADTRALPDRVVRVVRTAIRASKLQAFDPMERAFSDIARQLNFGADDAGGTLVREYPLSDRLLAVTQAWRGSAGRAGYDVAAKGAPEAILELCRLPPDRVSSIEAQVERLAGQGLRVIGVASGAWDAAALPESPRQFTFEFLGLIGLADPVRPGVPAAVEECRTAGIRVVMLTGDYPLTALSIARQIGLSRPHGCLTGAEISRIDDAGLRREVANFDVFARIVPDQKLRLVAALQANGDVVAMTGDGVNDGPALKAADIGIAMGGRGADVAREAAALVLLDDDFSSIVRAVRLGRRIYDNIRKATNYVLAIHVPIAGISLIPALLGWPLVLMPVHVLFMELITDPTCSIAFEVEPEEPGLMRRPPRRATARLITWTALARSLLQGAGALAVAIGVLVLTRTVGLTDTDSRTLTFATLIVVNLALTVSNRSETSPVWMGLRPRNVAFTAIAFGALGILALIVSVPALRYVFHVSPMHPPDLLVLAGAALVALAWMEVARRVVPAAPA